MNTSKEDFCSGVLYKDIAKILSKNLLSEQIDLESIYEKMIHQYNDEIIIRDNFSNININDFIGYGSLLSNKKKLENIGIDLPIYFGNMLDSKKRVMIVAMDPKRNNQKDTKISVGTVFALNSKKDRETNRNDYWKFIKPLLSNHFVYLTDVFKLYYETYTNVNGKQVKLVSNKDSEFVFKNSEPFERNKKILEEEINIIAPEIIISLGKESENALKLIQGIESKELELTHNNVRYIFMPHISRTVTQSITTIANLFITLGKLKENNHFVELGNSINSARKSLFEKELVSLKNDNTQQTIKAQ